MAKYIDGDAVLKILSEEAAHRILHSDGRNFDIGRVNGLILAKDIVSKQPTADVAPVKRGEWKDSYVSGYTPADGIVCGACDCWAPRRSNYCPNCGALNKGEGAE